MTIAELNRDIKRLKKERDRAFEELKGVQYFNHIEGQVKNEFLRLYRADMTAESISKKSLCIMISLNHTHRFVPLHLMYVDICTE